MLQTFHTVDSILSPFQRKDIHKSDLIDLAKGVNAELNHIKTNISLATGRQACEQNCADPCLIYQKRSQKKGNSVFIPELHTPDFDQGREPMDIDSEIVSLQSHISRLELELQWKERFYRRKLDQFSQSIPDTVCIQPSCLSVSK